MEWMVILMVALLVMGGHHGVAGSHDAKPPGAGAAHVHTDDSGTRGENKR